MNSPVLNVLESLGVLTRDFDTGNVVADRLQLVEVVTGGVRIIFATC